MNALDALSNLSINTLAVFPYGSRVYGTYSEDSDFDYIVITDDSKYAQLIHGNINFNFYSMDQFQEKINNHEIDALECLFLNPELVVKNNVNFTFKLDLSKLRSESSKTSSNSWVKCKKKLTIEKDFNPTIAKKSLFHSFRIIYFSIDIAKTGKINNYGQCNDLFHQIMNAPNDWEYLKNNYQEKYNKLMSDFRRIAPK